MSDSGHKLRFVDAAVHVRYAETDQMGIVYYANYLVWFEVGRAAWCRARGFRYRDLETEHGRMLVVAEATCRYKAPARYEDDILIRTAAASATEKVIRFHYEVRNQHTGQLLVLGDTTHVVTDRDLRPARLPDKFLQLFKEETSPE
jgi:acyl-CoA thioester hydrolase